MGQYFSLTLNQVGTAKLNTKKIKKREGKTSIGILLAVAVFLLSIFYVMQVNDLTTKGYQIKKLETRVAELKESHKRLELEAASLQSLQNIENQTRTLNLVPSGQVRYISNTREYALDR